MVITSDVKLPTFKDLEMQEVNLSTCHLMAAAPYLGKYCEGINNEYMLCRYEYEPDPRPCLDIGKLVTRCTLEFFRKVKKTCLEEHNVYANCIDKSSVEYASYPCRKTQEVYRRCMKDKMYLPYPGFGYFTRGRIHRSACGPDPQEAKEDLKKEMEEKCPVEDLPGEVPEATPDKPRKPARFGTRSFWMME